MKLKVPAEGGSAYGGKRQKSKIKIQEKDRWK